MVISVSEGYQVWTEDFENVKWGTAFSGLDVEKVQRHGPPTLPRVDSPFTFVVVNIGIEIIRGD